ncbi:nuclear transport factor 2 family protein [Caballeronia sp. GAWG2-1]|uniref:nuclear transport factor 2 family protein n=1 Tax=Caballeronia sp. GAWG2-1 TaxID=2921744 RepID=UPI00202969DC|nr:nuclear transport factor 2 family protein [Caballeronia sp. GAWG2-1]
MPDETLDPVEVARRVYEAYVRKDRAAIEALIAKDFHFTSPRDNRLDRATYFARCWPNANAIATFDFVHMRQDGEHVFVTYDARMLDGKAFRNSEILSIRAGKLHDAQVFFGWTLPHEAPEGDSITA